MELLGDAESKFAKLPYADLVKWDKKLDQSITHFTTTDPWAMETVEVRQMIGETQQNLLLLRDRSVGPLVSMYNYYTDWGSQIPANKIQEAFVGLQGKVAFMKAGTGQASLGMARFGTPVPSPGAGLAALEARMVAAEHKNANFEVSSRKSIGCRDK